MITGVIIYATTYRFPVYRPCAGPMPVPTSAHSPIGGAGCLAALGTKVWSKGANQMNVPLDCVPLAPQYPFERPAGGVLQVPERLKKVWQFGGFASLKSRRTALYSPAEVDAQRAAPRKGFLNRRFKHVFAYFWRAPKVGAGSGGAEPSGQQVEIFSIYCISNSSAISFILIASILLTPFSCMVTPYRTSASSMVPRRWVITINCVLSEMDRI